MGNYCSEVTDTVWIDKCYIDRGDGHTTLRMHSILLTYRFKRVERLTNLPSDILTHMHARSQTSIKTLWTRVEGVWR